MLRILDVCRPSSASFGGAGDTCVLRVIGFDLSSFEAVKRFPRFSAASVLFFLFFLDGRGSRSHQQRFEDQAWRRAQQNLIVSTMAHSCPTGVRTFPNASTTEQEPEAAAGRARNLGR